MDGYPEHTQYSSVLTDQVVNGWMSKAHPIFKCPYWPGCQWMDVQSTSNIQVSLLTRLSMDGCPEHTQYSSVLTDQVVNGWMSKAHPIFKCPYWPGCQWMDVQSTPNIQVSLLTRLSMDGCPEHTQYSSVLTDQVVNGWMSRAHPIFKCPYWPGCQWMDVQSTPNIQVSLLTRLSMDGCPEHTQYSSVLTDQVVNGWMSRAHPIFKCPYWPGCQWMDVQSTPNIQVSLLTRLSMDGCPEHTQYSSVLTDQVVNGWMSRAHPIFKCPYWLGCQWMDVQSTPNIQVSLLTRLSMDGCPKHTQYSSILIDFPPTSPSPCCNPRWNNRVFFYNTNVTFLTFL